MNNIEVVTKVEQISFVNNDLDGFTESSIMMLNHVSNIESCIYGYKNKSIWS